jgi:hypothetical protein
MTARTSATTAPSHKPEHVPAGREGQPAQLAREMFGGTPSPRPRHCQEQKKRSRQNFGRRVNVGRVQIQLGSIRFSATPTQAVELAKLLVAAVDELRSADGAVDGRG